MQCSADCFSLNGISTSGESNLTERPHRRRTWTVQKYSPCGANRVCEWV